MRPTPWILAGFVALALLVVLTVFVCHIDTSPFAATPSQPANPPVFDLRLGHDMPTDSAQHEAALKFAALIRERTRGQVRIRVHPDSELGSDRDMIAMARSGELAFILPPTAKLSDIAPEMQLPDLPFLFPDRESCYRVLDGPPGQQLLARLRPRGLVGLSFWESGFKHFTANQPLRQPDDFAGLRFRVMHSELLMRQFETLGATAVPISFHETRQALAEGLVDGQENPLVSIVNMGFNEVQSHLMLSAHGYLGYAFSMSEAVFEQIPEEWRTVIRDTAQEVAVWEREETQRREDTFLESIRQSGMTVVELTRDQRETFREATAPLYLQYLSLGGGEILDGVLAMTGQSMPSHNAVLIGLDADMSSGSAPSGEAIRRGALLAIDEINASGGVLGRPLALNVRDHRGNPARGEANLDYFATQPGLVAVLGGLHTPVMLSELETLHRHRLISLVPWAAGTAIVSNGYEPNYVFRLSVRDEFAGAYLVDKALERGATRVGLLLEQTGWGRSNQEAMTAALRRHGLSPVAVEWFNWGMADADRQLRNVLAADADVILLVANAPEGITIVNSLSGFPPDQRLPIIAHWGITGGTFHDEVGDRLNDMDLDILQTYSFLSPTRPDRASSVIQAYIDKFPAANSVEDIFAPVGTAHAYDLVHLLARAIEQAGTLDRPTVRSALERLPRHEGLVRVYDPPFTPDRHDALTPGDFRLARYNEQGVLIPLEGQEGE